MEDSVDHLVLPLGKKQLGEFISSLLGQPQNIEREIIGQFDIDHNWLLNLLDLLNQRIINQNEAKLVSFHVQIGFTNDSKRNFYSLNEFIHYNEVKQYETESVKIEMKYLISFPGDKTPKSHQIILNFDKKSSRKKDNISLFERTTMQSIGSILYKIDYSERSWGDDIDRIISDEVEKIVKKKSSLSILGRMLLMLFSTICMYGLLLFPLLNSEKYIKDQKDSLIKEISSIETITDSVKIDFLYKLNTLQAENSGVSVVLFLVGMILGAIVMVLTFLLIKRKSVSFIILTSFDKDKKKKSIDNQQIKLVFTVLGYLVSIACGIISNCIYTNIVS